MTRHDMSDELHAEAALESVKATRDAIALAAQAFAAKPAPQPKPKRWGRIVGFVRKGHESAHVQEPIGQMSESRPDPPRRTAPASWGEPPPHSDWCWWCQDPVQWGDPQGYVLFWAYFCSLDHARLWLGAWAREWAYDSKRRRRYGPPLAPKNTDERKAA